VGRLRPTGVLAILVAAVTLASTASAKHTATHATNPFAGLWDTTLSQGVTGTVTFKVVGAAAGQSALRSIGGQPCAQPTVYYEADYTDTAPDTGRMVACGSGSALAGRYRNASTQLSYPGGSLSIKLDASGKDFSGYFTADDPTFAGEQFPYSGTFVKHVSGDGCCPAPAGGSGPTTAPTAKVPFGTPVSIAYRLGGIVQVPSPTLPAATTEVDLNEQITDAEIDQFIAVLKMAVAAYNRRRTIDALTAYCLIFVPNGPSQLGVPNIDNTDDCSKFAETVLSKKKKNGRLLASSARACSAVVVPVWRSGTRPTQQQYNAAVAVGRSQVHASCSSPSTTRLSLKVTSPANTTLNQVLGGNAHAYVGASGKAAGSANLTLTWAPPHSSVAPSKGKAKAGHYAGQTSANDPVSFDVTAGGAGVTNLRAAGHVTCGDGSGWTWTITSSSTSPIGSTLGFSRTYSGGLTISDPKIANVNVSYKLTGTLTASGTAKGSFQISHIRWDQSGTHYDCTGSAASWTARLG
jgi:hypothetical protein